MQLQFAVLVSLFMFVILGTWLKFAHLSAVSMLILLHPCVLCLVPVVKPFAMRQLVCLSLTRPTGTLVNRSAVFFRRNSMWQPSGTLVTWCSAVLVLLKTRRQESDWRSTLSMSTL